MRSLTTKIELIEDVACLLEPATAEHGRYKVLYGGRGSVKSWSFARAALIRGANKKRRNKLQLGQKPTDPIPFRVLCAREIQNSIEESVHHLLESQINMLNLQPFYDVQKYKIFGKPRTSAEGTEFIFRGLHAHVTELKSTEAIDIAWISEANKVSKNAWENLIPTIRTEYDDGTVSEIWADFNPELESDEAYVRFIKRPPKNAIVIGPLTYRNNPWFPKVLEQERLTMKEQEPDDYLTVWEGKVRQALSGAVFAKELRAAKEAGRICIFEPERGIPVNTYWDLGRRDATAVWFVQRVGLQWRVIDFYQSNFEHIDHYIAMLQSKPYVYGTHYLPHDGKAKVLGSKRTIEEQLRGADEDDKAQREVVVLPAQAISDQHNALRSLFPNMWFHEINCAEGLSWLGRYRWAVNNDTNQLKGAKPIHDDASHASSALMQFAIAAREPERRRRQKVEELMNPVPYFDGSPLAWMGH